ncbi:type 1 fimbrial protein [Providencia rettgeri]|nr:type 1 fimbrial protein [Providencia rettgeri]
MRILFLFLLLLLPAVSQAVTCQATPGNTNVNIPAGINFPPNLPINGLIGEYKGPRTAIVPCTSTSDVTRDFVTISAMGIVGKQIDGVWVFNSELPGIGYAFGGEVEGCGGISWVENGGWVSLVCDRPSSLGTYVYFTPSVRLYKIGTLGLSNTYPMQIVGSVSRNVNGTLYSGRTFFTSEAKVVAAACTISSTNVNVNMDSVEKRLFSGIGSTAGNTKDVNISLNCTRKANVTVSVTGDTNDANNGLLNLTKDQKSAKGIAIQMLLNGNPFKLNTYNSVGDSTQGLYTIPLKARYYQTGDISPGTANSTATFNVVYQ